MTLANVIIGKRFGLFVVKCFAVALNSLRITFQACQRVALIEICGRKILANQNAVVVCLQCIFIISQPVIYIAQIVPGVIRVWVFIYKLLVKLNAFLQLPAGFK